MNDKDNRDTRIETIKLRIGDQDIELNLDEVRLLRNRLNDAFPVYQSPIYIPFQSSPQWPYQLPNLLNPSCGLAGGVVGTVPNR